MGHPKGYTNTSGAPRGNPRNQGASSGDGTTNPFTVRTSNIGVKRDNSGTQKTSSTGATDNSTNSTPRDMVPCNVCGGFHSTQSHKEYGTGFKCPYQRNKHTQINEGIGEFLLSEIGKQYNAKYPWDLLDISTNTMIPQYRN